jgi:hypothetical protein
MFPVDVLSVFKHIFKLNVEEKCSFRMEYSITKTIFMNEESVCKQITGIFHKQAML